MVYFPKISFRFLIILLFFFIGLVLTGCTHSTRLNSCTTTQKNDLIKEYNYLSYKIIQRRSELISANEKIETYRCRRSFFSQPNQSNICESTFAQINAIKIELAQLQSKAAIYHNVVNGKIIEHPSLREDGCAVRNVSKEPLSTYVKPKKTVSKTTAAQKKVSVESRIELSEKSDVTPKNPLEDVKYTVYTPPASVKITHEIIPETLEKREKLPEVSADNALSFTSAPTKQTVPIIGAERPYQPNPKIRIVGSKFFPDLEEAEAQPVQDLNP